LGGDDELKQFIKNADDIALVSLLEGRISDDQLKKLLNDRDPQPLIGPIRLAIEEARAGAIRGIENKKAEEGALKRQIQAVRSEIAELQREVADLHATYLGLQREIEGLNEKHRLARDWQAQVEIESDAIDHAEANLKEGVDLKIISAAVVPDFRVYPQKALICIVAGIIGFLLSSLLVIISKYIKDAQRIERV
jgi:uncharacterized protein involved in exopolysaccharide biosynthesis